jgi:hypothetical protein
VALRNRLRKQLLTDTPKRPRPVAQMGKAETIEGIVTTPLVLQCEPDLPLHAVLRNKVGVQAPSPACLFLHLDGKDEALKHPGTKALAAKGWTVIVPELRGTGVMRPANDKIGEAADHTSAEHALWVGRPLLGQWLFDVQVVLDWLGLQPDLDRKRIAVVGVGAAGVLALCAGTVLDDWVTAVVALGSPVSLVTEEAYGSVIRMGLLAPGLLRTGDVPHLAALIAPRRLVIRGGLSPKGSKRTGKQLDEAYGFTIGIFKLLKAPALLTLGEDSEGADLPALLG